MLTGAENEVGPSFTISIDWGDSTSSAGGLVGGPSAYSVISSHTYPSADTYTVTVTVTDTATGATAQISVPITVGDASDAGDAGP